MNLVAATAFLILLFQPATQTMPKFDVKLHAAHASIAPGSTSELMIEISVSEPWHIYHPVILDTGAPTRLRFTTPPGVEIGDVRFPDADARRTGRLRIPRVLRDDSLRRVADRSPKTCKPGPDARDQGPGRRARLRRNVRQGQRRSDADDSRHRRTRRAGERQAVRRSPRQPCPDLRRRGVYQGQHARRLQKLSQDRRARRAGRHDPRQETPPHSGSRPRRRGADRLAAFHRAGQRDRIRGGKRPDLAQAQGQGSPVPWQGARAIRRVSDPRAVQDRRQEIPRRPRQVPRALPAPMLHRRGPVLRPRNGGGRRELRGRYAERARAGRDRVRRE